MITFLYDIFLIFTDPYSVFQQTF